MNEDPTPVDDALSHATFGLRSSRWLTPPLAWVSIGLALVLAAVLTAARPNRGPAYLILWLVATIWQLWATPVRVEVSGATLVWRTLIRRVTVPLSSVSGVGRSTLMRRRLTIQFRDRRSLPVYVVRGTTQFVLSLENRCPGISLPELEALAAEDKRFGANTHFYQHG